MNALLAHELTVIGAGTIAVALICVTILGVMYLTEEGIVACWAQLRQSSIARRIRNYWHLYWRH